MRMRGWQVSFQALGDDIGHLIDPRRIRDYRNIAGLPIENKGRFLIVGELIDPRGIRVERAAPIGSNRGGLVEYQIPNPRRQVRILQVIGLNPPF
jgi:hypothetical protein